MKARGERPVSGFSASVRGLKSASASSFCPRRRASSRIVSSSTGASGRATSHRRSFAAAISSGWTPRRIPAMSSRCSRSSLHASFTALPVK